MKIASKASKAKVVPAQPRRLSEHLAAMRKIVIKEKETKRMKKRILELRAEDVKSLEEQRAVHVEKMEELLKKAKEEQRAMTSEEQTAFDEAEKKIKEIDATIGAEQRAAKLRNVIKTSQGKNAKTDESQKQQEEAEVRAFANWIRGKVTEERAGEIQMTQGNNGSIVPATIANRIIKAVRDMVPYLTKADVINTNGKLSIPVYKEDSTNYINADYVDEGTALTDNVGKFTTVDLTGYVIGALSLVSNKLVTNSDIDIVNFVVNEVARAMSEKLEEEFTIGTTGKITGITATENVIEAASATAITYDELVSLKHKLKQQFRKNAVWIMNDSTYTAICKLKDANNQPYFKDDEYKILGCDVLVSDSMPELKASEKAIVFGDLSGYTIKGAKTVEVQVLREKYADRNMLGVIAFCEYDAKISDAKKICALKMKAS